MKTIFFDLDDTIYDTKPIYDLGLKLAHQLLEKKDPSLQMSFDRFQQEYDAARKEVQKIISESPAKHSRLLYFKKMLERVKGKSNPSLALALDNAYAAAFLNISAAPKELHLLAEEFSLGIITNQICLTQLQKLAMVDPEGTLFHFVVTSEEVGVEKPNAKIFLEALARAKCTVEEAVMVGDDWKADILGASAIGMACIYVSAQVPPHELPPNTQWIKSLSELPGILCSI